MSRGSQEAAWELAEIYSPHVIRAVRQRLPSEIRAKFDSQDFVQAVWASILLKREQLDQFTTPEHFVAYLVAVAKNKVLMEYRGFRTKKRDVRLEVDLATTEEGGSRKPSQPRHGQHPLASDAPTPSHIAQVRDLWDVVLRESSVREQEMIAMRIEGKSYRQIAEHMDINEKTVRRTINGKLAELLK